MTQHYPLRMSGGGIDAIMFRFTTEYIGSQNGVMMRNIALEQLGWSNSLGLLGAIAPKNYVTIPSYYFNSIVYAAGTPAVAVHPLGRGFVIGMVPYIPNVGYPSGWMNDTFMALPWTIRPDRTIYANSNGGTTAAARLQGLYAGTAGMFYTRPWPGAKLGLSCFRGVIVGGNVGRTYHQGFHLSDNELTWRHTLDNINAGSTAVAQNTTSGGGINSSFGAIDVDLEGDLGSLGYAQDDTECKLMSFNYDPANNVFAPWTITTDNVNLGSARYYRSPNSRQHFIRVDNRQYPTNYFSWGTWSGEWGWPGSEVPQGVFQGADFSGLLHANIRASANIQPIPGTALLLLTSAAVTADGRNYAQLVDPSRRIVGTTFLLEQTLRRRFQYMNAAGRLFIVRDGYGDFSMAYGTINWNNLTLEETVIPGAGGGNFSNPGWGFIRPNIPL